MIKLKYVAILSTDFQSSHGYVSYRKIIRDALDMNGESINCKISDPTIECESDYGIFGKCESGFLLENIKDAGISTEELIGHHFTYYPNFNIYVLELPYQGMLFYHILKHKYRGNLITWKLWIYDLN